MSTSKWKSWCRLCARVDITGEIKLDTIKCISNILQKYFQISISSSDNCLSVVCQECLDLLQNVENFAIRCAKVDKMFLELAKGSFTDDKVESVRDIYGFSKSFEYINCESSQLEAKSEPALKEKDIYYAASIVNDNDNNDASYTSDIEVPRKKPKISRKQKMCSEAKSIQSACKKRNKPSETKPKSTKRKPIRGTTTDVLCQFCEITFEQPHRYISHMRNKHSPTVLPYVCDECPKCFVSEKKMLRHAACHRPVGQKKIHPCPECDRTFTRADNVQMHRRIVHIGERPFVCEECGKGYATKAALKEHQVSHSNLRPFKCNDCPMCFKDLRALQRHSVRHSAFVRSFECLECGHSMSTLQTLRNHMVVHSDEKRHKCQHCGNAYKRYKTLKAHLITHTGLRPYACPFCEVTYANGSNLRTHKKKFHPLELAALEAAGQVKLALDVPKV